ncbi:MAG: hypothetical protein PUE32_00920 [Clostridia bacterium]|nr:hypothetical protein [Clostridia bacterium]
MEVTTQYAGVSYAGYYATKTTSTTTFESTIDAQGAADEERMSAKNYTETVTSKESTGETMSAADVFKMLVETLKEEHKLTPDNIAVEEDWREMDDENWNKLLEHIDKYIDDFKERLKQLEEQTEKAAMKANADAPADQRAAAISNAILSTINSGTADGSSEAGYLEKLSWTYEMATDDQAILATAKMANEAAHNALTKTQEMALFGDTTVGISSNESVRECASLEKNDGDRVWTITAFTEQGIVSNKCQNGKIISHWELNYKNPDDARRVQDFLDKFDKEANLIFSGSKDFWEEFLTENVDGDSLFAAYEAAMPAQSVC